MPLTPTEAAVRELHINRAKMKVYEDAIDTMLGKGERTFHFSNPEFLAYLPILAARYDAFGWQLATDTQTVEGQTYRLHFIPKPDAPKDKAEVVRRLKGEEPTDEEPTAKTCNHLDCGMPGCGETA